MGFRALLVLETHSQVREFKFGRVERTVGIFGRNHEFLVLTDEGKTCKEHELPDLQATEQTGIGRYHFSMTIYEQILYMCGGQWWSKCV